MPWIVLLGKLVSKDVLLSLFRAHILKLEQDPPFGDI